MPVIRARRELLVHEDFAFVSDAEFGARAAVFLAEGLPNGDHLVAITSRRRLDRLVADVPGPVECHEAAAWFGAPARTLAAMADAGHRRWWRHGRVRIVAEPPWSGRTVRERVEWTRFEALINRVFADTPSWILCAYDLRATPPEIMAAARRTHRGEHYLAPELFCAACDREPLPPPGGQVTVRGVCRGELPAVRAFTERAGLDLGLKNPLPLVLSVHEVATNILKHGSGRAVLLIWTDGRSVICDLADPRGRLDDPFLGYIPPDPDRTGRAGMWAVRQLCDLVETRSGPAGTLFRLHLARRPRRPTEREPP